MIYQNVENPKWVFISYSRQQSPWVDDRLVPCLRTGGANVLIDVEQFEAARSLGKQMTEVQDKAEVHVLVFTPDYLRSKPCKAEMKHALERDPDFDNGVVIPVIRVPCDLPAKIKRPNPLSSPIYIDLSDDRKADEWRKLLEKCGPGMGVPAPSWLRARDEVRDLLGRRKSVNLVAPRCREWRGLIDDIRGRSIKGLGVVDLLRGAASTRRGLVEEILKELGLPYADVPKEPNDLKVLDRRLSDAGSTFRLALTHFDVNLNRIRKYDRDFFDAIAHLVGEGILVLLIQSRSPCSSVFPQDVDIDLQEVVLD